MEAAHSLPERLNCEELLEAKQICHLLPITMGVSTLGKDLEIFMSQCQQVCSLLAFLN